MLGRLDNVEKHPKDSPVLTKRQSEVLRLLNRGKTYAKVREELGISAANLHLICWHIRRKTGIASTRNQVDIRAFSQASGKPLPPLAPRQRAVLLLYVEGKTHSEIAATLGMSRATSWNQACQGCKRLGLSGNGSARIAEVRAALGLADGPQVVTMEDPAFN